MGDATLLSPPLAHLLLIHEMARTYGISPMQVKEEDMEILHIYRLGQIWEMENERRQNREQESQNDGTSV